MSAGRGAVQPHAGEGTREEPEPERDGLCLRSRRDADLAARAWWRATAPAVSRDYHGAGGLEAHIGASTFYIAIHDAADHCGTRHAMATSWSSGRSRGLMAWRTPEGEFRAAAKVRIPVRSVGRTWEDHGAGGVRKEVLGHRPCRADRAGSGGGAGAVAL